MLIWMFIESIETLVDAPHPEELIIKAFLIACSTWGASYSIGSALINSFVSSVRIRLLRNQLRIPMIKPPICPSPTTIAGVLYTFPKDGSVQCSNQSFWHFVS